MVRANIKWGSSALAASIVAGEFYKFTDEERLATYRSVVDEADGKLPVWAGVAHLGTEPSIKLAKEAKDAGVDGIIAQAGLVGKDASDGSYEHFASILSRLDIPVMIQDAEDFNGIKIDPRMYAKLADEYSNLVAVKIEGGNTLEKIRETKSILGERKVSILGGMGGRLILEELPLGTSGSIPNACLADLVVETFSKSTSGRSDEARKSFTRMKPWLEFQTRHSLSASEIVKETLRARGVIKSSATRSPHVPLGDGPKSELRELLRGMSLMGEE